MEGCNKSSYTIQICIEIGKNISEIQMEKIKKNDLIILSNYPIAIDKKKVGTYPLLVKSGGGYFYDEVLEYRVWIHPELGGKDLCEGLDYFHAFSIYEEALEFSQHIQGAEEPLVLILQKEWIEVQENEVYLHKKGKRLSEWAVNWLESNKRDKNSIKNFFAVVVARQL